MVAAEATRWRLTAPFASPLMLPSAETGTLKFMDSSDALAALMQLAGEPVAVDVVITKVGSTAGMPVPKSTDLHWTQEGVLEIREEDMPTDRAVDEAAWRRLDPDSKLSARIIPDGSIGLFRFRDRFRSAHWDGSVLVIELGGMEYRIVRLVRPAGDYVVRVPPIHLATPAG